MEKKNIQLLSNAISYLSDAGETLHLVHTEKGEYRDYKLNEAKNDIFVAIEACNIILKSFADDLKDETLPFEPDKKEE